MKFRLHDEWLLQATEEEGRAAGSSAAQPWEGMRSGSYGCGPCGRGLSSKLLVFEQQLDHEVAVLELERQVALLELEENFMRLSDLVNETEALESERQVAVVELEDNFKQLSDHVAELEHGSKLEFEQASDLVKELGWVARRGQADICTLEFKFKQLTETIVDDLVRTESETLNEVEAQFGPGTW